MNTDPDGRSGGRTPGRHGLSARAGFGEPLPMWFGLSPTVAVLIGIYCFNNALLSVAIYHAGIVFCLLSKRTRVRIFSGMNVPVLLALSAGCILTWPLITMLWPYMHLPGIEFPGLLDEWGMNAIPILVFGVYSILVHPVLEEVFWRGLMPDRLSSDVLFGFFHVLVLVQIVHWPWALVCFLILTGAGSIWRLLARKCLGLWIPIFSHAAADLGILLAVRALM